PTALQLDLAGRTDCFFAGIYREDVSPGRLSKKFLAAARTLLGGTKGAFAGSSTVVVSRRERGRGDYCSEIDARTAPPAAQFALRADDHYYDRLRLSQKIGAAVGRSVVFASRFLASDAS